ncbi:helix-turn-helix transcriptional regulator [Parapedobacter koreensis]|nr:helix-turn-helix transcriptional regulator [Parapedobacter koreensis]
MQVDFKNQQIIKNKFMPDYKINRISEVLEEKEMKNNDLVVHLKVKKETVSRWVNNKQQPTLNTLNDIAKFLKVDIRELLHQSEWVKVK